MTFLNLFMLFGVAAASIPLIIHLLNRSKFEVVDWGAMHLLETVIEENNRRIRIFELLLLLIRCMIPIILALCLARPLVNSLALGGLESNIETLILLDDSLSMARQDGKTKSRFQQAKDLIDDLQQNLGDRSLVTIMPSGIVSPPLEQPLAGEFSIQRSLEQAVNFAAKNRDKAYEILVLSDFQAFNLDGLDDEKMAELNQRRTVLPKPPAISLLPMAESSEQLQDNLRIASIEIDSAHVMSNQSFVVRAEIVNEGINEISNVDVFLVQDGTQVAQRSIELLGNGSKQIEFEHTLSDANLGLGGKQRSSTHLLTVLLERSDDSLADNQQHTVMNLSDPIRVAVVSQPGRSESIDNERDNEANAGEFLSVALSPFAFAGSETTLKDSIETVRIAGSKFKREDLADLNVLVLVDPGQLSDEIVREITQFVADGGGLVIFAGPRMQQDLNWVNQNLGSSGAQWFDFNLQKREENDDSNPAIRQIARLQNNRLEHPTMMFFNDEDNGSISEAEFTDWLIVNQLSQNSKSIVDFITGTPMAIETNLDSGTILFCATSADTTWNNLPLRPIYLPIMQRWVEYLAYKSDPPIESQTGVSASVALASFDLEDVADDDVRVTSPTGRELDFTIRDEDKPDDAKFAFVQWSDTRAAGAYEVLTGGNQRSYYVAKAMEGEWTSQPLEQSTLREFAERMEMTVATSMDEYSEMRSERVFGFEIWKWVWWCVLGLMVFERAVVMLLTRAA